MAYNILLENVASRVLGAFYIPSNQNFTFSTKDLCAVRHDYHSYGMLDGINPASQQPFG